MLLHVGLGTFRPVKVENIEEHHMHSEYFEVTEDAAKRINAARERGGRIVAVGTTSVRTLQIRGREWAAGRKARRNSIFGEKPGYVGSSDRRDALITNFHLPGSTLMMLVSHCADREKIIFGIRAGCKGKIPFSSHSAMQC